MTDTTQPPAETMAAGAARRALVESVARIIDPAKFAAFDKAGIAFGDWVEGSPIERGIRPTLKKVEAILAALTRRAGGDAGTIDRCIEKLEQTARWSINDGRKWFNHPAANEAFEYAIAALRTVEHDAGGDAIPAGEQDTPCDVCQGNGEVVTDWDRYLHGKPDDAGDEGTAECDACDGTGRVSITPKPPAGGDAGAVRWRERWYGSDPQRGSAIVDEAGNLIAYFGGDEEIHRATTAAVAAHNAALALPAPVVEGDVEKEAPLVTKMLAYRQCAIIARRFSNRVDDYGRSTRHPEAVQAARDVADLIDGEAGKMSLEVAALSEGRSHG